MNKQIVDEAAEWFVEINQGQPDRATRQKFDAWLRQSPEHTRAYLRMLPFWEHGAQLDVPEASGDPQALIAWARAGDNVVHLEDRAEGLERPRSRGRWTAALTLAASVAIAVLGIWLYGQGEVHATGIGEQRLIPLEDGSSVQLNSRSKLKVRFTERGRDVDLLEGQALFSVAHDNARPFVVHSADASIRAVGTRFDVYRKTGGTIVTVLEGRVVVAHHEGKSQQKEAADVVLNLAAGEQLTVAAAKPLTKAQPTRSDVAVATAWTQQRLVFSKTPLAEVAEEFNRYNERRLVVEKNELGAFNVSGTFLSTDPESLLRFLRKQTGLQVIETGSEIRISATE